MENKEHNQERRREKYDFSRLYLPSGGLEAELNFDGGYEHER